MALAVAVMDLKGVAGKGKAGGDSMILPYLHFWFSSELRFGDGIG